MWTSEYPVWWKQTPANTVLLCWCFRWHILFLWSFASILVLNNIRTPCFWLKQAPMKMWPLFDSHISSAGLQVSPKRSASHLHLSISLKSSSNLSTLLNDLTFFGLMSKDISEYVPSFFSSVLLLVLPSSFSWSWLSLRLSLFGCVFGVCPCLWVLNGKSPRVFEQIPCPSPKVVTCWRPLIVMSSSRLPVSLWKLLRVLCINCLTSVDPSFRLFVHVLSRICGIWGLRWSWLWSRVHLVPIRVSFLLWCEFFSMGFCKFCWSNILRIPAVSVRNFPLGPCLAWTECSCRRWCIGVCWPSGEIHFCLLQRSRWPICFFNVFLHHEFLDHIQSKLSHFLFRRHFNETCGNGSS